MITSQVVTDNAGIGLVTQGNRTRDAIKSAVWATTIHLQSDIQTNYLSGQALQHRTGNLKRNIIVLDPQVSGNEVIGTVGVSTSAWYGKLHEFGGHFLAQRRLRLPSHPVMRTNGPAMTGDPYTIHFPERSFMRRALKTDTENGSVEKWYNTALQAALR